MDYGYDRPGWFRAATTYREALAPASNYPLAYIFGVFLAISGHIIGRGAYIRYVTPLYPNQYVCLVGPSGLAHKSTAMNLGYELAQDYLAEPIRSLVTSQGLLEKMTETGGGGFVILDELANLLNIRRRDYASDLISQLTMLYSCPPVVQHNARHSPIRVEDPLLSLLSGSTVEWLRQSLSASDLMAGFGNRMTFILGDPRADRAWPIPVRKVNLDWERLVHYHGEVRLDEEARTLWDYHFALFSESQRNAGLFHRVLNERTPDKILKTAIIIAAWYDTYIIDRNILAAAIDWGGYLSECITELAPAFEDVEQQVLAAIRLGHNTKTNLFKSLSHTIPVKRIRDSLSNLTWLGFITEDSGYYHIN